MKEHRRIRRQQRWNSWRAQRDAVYWTIEEMMIY